MKEKLTIEQFGVKYESLWVASDPEDAMSLLRNRILLDVGDRVTLTNGKEYIVVENLRNKDVLLCCRPSFYIDGIDSGTERVAVKYGVVMDSNYGYRMDYEDIVRLNGPTMVRKLLEEEDWEEAASVLNDMAELSMDISEFAGDLATIKANIDAEDEAADKDSNLMSLIKDCMMVN